MSCLCLPFNCTGIDSDEEFFQDQEDPTAPEGDILTPSDKNLLPQAERIVEPHYRDAFQYVHGINLRKERKKVIADFCFLLHNETSKHVLFNEIAGIEHHLAEHLHRSERCPSIHKHKWSPFRGLLW